MGTVLKGGRVITASDSFYGDIRIEGEKIEAIGFNLEKKSDEVVSVKGCYLLPGAIDPHTHFELDTGFTITADDFESGTKAALAGGTTSIIDYATQDKGGTLIGALESWHKKSKEKCYCDYSFHMSITDWNDNISAEMEDMIKKGVTSFKMYMAYKGKLQVDDGVILNALKRSREIGGIIGFHCENGDIVDTLIKEARMKGNLIPKYHPLTRPDLAEGEAVNRVIQLGKMAESPVYIVHLSSKAGLESVLRGRRDGALVYAETCPQYLLLEDSKYLGTENDAFDGAKFVMSPPVRKKQDNEALWGALKKGEIDTTATDHCSFNYLGQKSMGRSDFSKIPNGAPGVEHRFMLLYTYGVLGGYIDMNSFAALTSTNAAKIFGLYPRKGTIAIGSDADIVVLNPKGSTVITWQNQRQNVDYTPFEGFEVRGSISKVFLRGREVVSDGIVTGSRADGGFIERRAFSSKGCWDV